MMSEREMEALFFGIKIEYDSLFKKQQYEAAWKMCLDMWEKFPDPKYKQPLSYLWIEDVVNHGIETKQFALANKYIGFLFISDLERADAGDREYLAGKLAYEQGEIELAKELFLRSYEKEPSGMYFKGKENEKYRDLVRGHKKAKKASSSLSAKEMLSKAEDYLELGKYNKAKEYFQMAIDKAELYSEEEQDVIYRNGYSGLGDYYFNKNDYKTAKDYFFDAYNYEFENPYINLRIGQCLVHLDETEKAKEYLMRAYMMDGEEVFEGNEQYLEYIGDMIK